MLAIFRTNQFFTGILLIFYIFLLRFPVFLRPVSWMPSNTGVLTLKLYEYISPNGLYAQIAAILLLWLQSFLINSLVSQYRLAGEVTLLPGMIYILVCHFIPEFLYFSPLLIANTFLIISLFSLFDIYKKADSTGDIFNIGLWVGVASLFQFSVIVFILLGLIGLSSLRAFKLKEYFVLLTGCFLPYYLAGTYFFWYGAFSDFWQVQIASNIAYWDLMSPLHAWAYGKLIFFGVLLLVFLFSYGMFSYKQNIGVQKSISLLFWWMLLSGVTLLFQSHIGLDHLMILTIPYGILLSMVFKSMSRPLAELIHLILVASIILIQILVV